MKKLISLFLVLLLTFSLCSCTLLYVQINERIDTDDVSDYGKFRENDGLSQYLTFPKEIPDEASDVKYRYKYKYYLSSFDPSILVYLEYVLDEEGYEKELERIKGIDTTQFSVLEDNKNFCYPAYVSVAHNEYRYEYVLADEENCRLIYISLEHMYRKDIEFSKDYLPDYFLSDNFDDEEVFIYGSAPAREDNVKVFEHTSWFDRAEERGDEIWYFCNVTVRNGYSEEKRIRITADFSEEYDMGIIAESTLEGKTENGEDIFYLDGHKYEYITVVFITKKAEGYDGEAIKNDRKLPKLEVTVMKKIHGTTLFKYGDTKVLHYLSGEDLKTISAIFKDKQLYSDSLSCGFTENVSVYINKKTYCIACDNCPIIYIREEDKYFNITEEENEILRDILKEYGFIFPCV